jgi:diaminopimelate decarboxylase
MILYDHLNVNTSGHLTIGGLDTLDLAKEYGTPAYIMDENVIRKNIRSYKNAIEKYAPNGGKVLFASKALSFSKIYRIIAEEGIGTDIVSPGELYTAVHAGFPVENAYFHGNNKTDADINMGIEYGIGYFVADNREELDAINRISAVYGKKQKVLLRITPGIDPHTHKAVITGNVDSKFGTAIITGQAMEITKYALSLDNVDLVGFHSHIGSQILETSPFEEAAEIMVKYIADVKSELGFEAAELNLGGGFGVRYVPEQESLDIDFGVKAVVNKVVSTCEKYNVKIPAVLFEPGRSIVANAGITLYTVGSVKEITGFKNYVSIDGGMPDNPRYALYKSLYDAVICNRADAPKDYECTIAGRCCESGDLIAENIKIQSCGRDDIMAVLVTGAFNYTMASNYNRIPRPPVIMIKDGKSYVAVERESYNDLVKNDK